jgi:hypothetical protein
VAAIPPTSLARHAFHRHPASRLKGHPARDQGRGAVQRDGRYGYNSRSCVPVFADIRKPPQDQSLETRLQGSTSPFQ